METIFALATAPGRSGVAIIRISGTAAQSALAALGVNAHPAPRSAQFSVLKNANGETIDEALLLWFPAPASFTGENVLELHLHGSRAVIAEVTERLSALPGFRPAGPGEFTRRALLNGKMDLAEAEGLMDLIEAETRQQKLQALHFMEGRASAFFEDVRSRIIKALAHLEAYIDFPDEDIPPSVLTGLSDEIDTLAAIIRAQLDDNHYGEKIRDGIHIAIVGAPNAGKSSLLNTLARREAAIVSHIAGTTRDVVEVHLNIGGYPVVLADTAGIRETTDEIEREGIRRSMQRAGAADLTLVLLDAASGDSQTVITRLITPLSIVLLNKSDIAVSPALQFLDLGAIPISAKTGQGVELLIERLNVLLASIIPGREPSVITRARHRVHLSNALEYLTNFTSVTEVELKCEELRRAANDIGRITGRIDVEDVLDVVFSSFCIGK